MKNIPIPTRSVYLQKLVEMTERLTQRMRWKAFFFLNPEKAPRQIENYGFKTKNTAPHIKELEEFEQSMLELLQNIAFTPHQNTLLHTLAEDTKRIKTNEY